MKLGRNFSLLLIGQSLANIGDVLYIVSIIHLIYIITESAIAASFVPFTIASSMFVSSILTPLLFEKVNLKWLMAGSQIGKTCLLFLLGLLLYVTTATNFYLMFIVISMIAFLDGCANPIRQTLVPHYVQEEQLLKANGIDEAVTQFIQTVMWFVGSLFLLFLSSQQVVWVVGCLFIIASMVLCLLENVDHQSFTQQGKLTQIIKGWKLLWHTPVLRRVVWIDFLESIAGTVWIAAIILVFVTDALQVDEQWWGFLNGTFFVGLITGSVYCVKYNAFIERQLAQVMFVGSLCMFIATILFSVNTIPTIALFLTFCVGVFGQIKSIPQHTVIQKSVPKAELSSVFTSLSAISTGAFGISSLMMGIIADVIGVRAVFTISGLLLAVVCVIIVKNKHLFNR
ncbi:MFS transporter [Lysinibacillus sp. CD3-6]|uniref:MFS transporter n=1 Tax=Lysinibacillus sp. CD3-6 TaxID=2892541 RepID=UPI001170D2A1|nr:MFS transporter [Lysinibacillus sp. CD3-6]UED82025.1 MFS transporter [Lysinibacillus sp. CD3-6]